MGAMLFLAACAGGGGGGAGREPDAWEEADTLPGGAGPTIRIVGTVRSLALEGGLYVIDGAGGTRYHPTNLPRAYRVDGKAIEADARRRDDVASIGMVGPMVELLRIRSRAAGGSVPAGLTGTSWRLRDLGGTLALDDVEATLEFVETGRAAGNASCNRFTGPVTVSGTSLGFGLQAVTRKMCPEAVMRQETAYLEALRDAERYEIEGSDLYIYIAGRTRPLRFTRR